MSSFRTKRNCLRIRWLWISRIWNQNITRTTTTRRLSRVTKKEIKKSLMPKISFTRFRNCCWMMSTPLRIWTRVTCSTGTMIPMSRLHMTQSNIPRVINKKERITLLMLVSNPNSGSSSTLQIELAKPIPMVQKLVLYISFQNNW